MAAIKVSGSTGLVIVFVSQVIFGFIGFLALYVAAAALSYIVHLVNSFASNTAPWLPVIAPYIEMALFGVDLIAFALFTIAEVVRFAKALWQEMRSMTDRSEKADDLVTIDGAFFKRQAIEATRIYFAPFVGIWKAMAEATRPMSVKPSSERDVATSDRPRL